MEKWTPEAPVDVTGDVASIQPTKESLPRDLSCNSWCFSSLNLKETVTGEGALGLLGLYGDLMQGDSSTFWVVTWTSDFTSLLSYLICKMHHPRLFDQDNECEACQAVPGTWEAFSKKRANWDWLWEYQKVDAAKKNWHVYIFYCFRAHTHLKPLVSLPVSWHQSWKVLPTWVLKKKKKIPERCMSNYNR